MARRIAVRRGGAVHTTAGVVAVAVSSAAMLAAGPRQLGHSGFDGLALAWTICAVFGFGLAAPTEQLMTRRMNVAAARAMGEPITGLACTAVIAIVATVAATANSRAAHHFSPLASSASLGIAGWVLLTLVRARLAGAGDLRRYSVVLATEAATRIALVAIAVADSGRAAWWFGAAVGVPLLVASAAGIAAPSSHSTATEFGPRRLVTREQLAFIAVSAGFQACVNAPTLLVQWRTSTAGAVGAFVAANTYFRAPTILMGGIATHALVALSHAYGVGDERTFRALRLAAMRNVAVVTGTAIAAESALAPVLLPAYYGSNTGLPTALLVGLAVSSLLAVLAGIAVQPLLAGARTGSAAGAWVLGGAVCCGLFALSKGTDTLAVVALISGPAAALGLALVSGAEISRAHTAEATRPGAPRDRD